MMAGTSGELRSAADWDEYFGEGGGWERNGGREQSRLFAEQFCRRTSLPKDEPLSLLDYGCALGDSLPVIRRAFPRARLYGTDFSPVAIRRCAREQGETATFFLTGDERAPERFDAIYASNVLEHFPDFDRIARGLMEKSRFLSILVPYRETCDGMPLDEHSGGHHVRTLDEFSFDFFEGEGIARRIGWSVFLCQGAWGGRDWTPFRVRRSRWMNRIRIFLGMKPRSIPLQMLIEFESLR